MGRDVEHLQTGRVDAVQSKRAGIMVKVVNKPAQRSDLLYFVEKYSDVILVPGETVDRIGHNHVGSTLTEELPHSFNTLTLQGRPTGSVSDALHHLSAV